MTEPEVRGLFTLAGFNIHALYKLVNQYYGGAVDCDPVQMLTVYEEGKTLLDRGTYDFLTMAVPTLREPWWLVKTDFGLIEVGWRKRVISIDWRDTKTELVLTHDDVTHDRFMVHAWSMSKAVEYLEALKLQLTARKIELVKNMMKQAQS